MAQSKKDKIKKLKRKRVWPSLVVVSLFTALCIGMVIFALDLFSTYIVSTKLLDFYNEAAKIGTAIEQRVIEGYDVSASVKHSIYYGGIAYDLYAEDAEGNYIVSKGESVPLTDESFEWSESVSFTLVKDSAWEYSAKDLISIIKKPVAEFVNLALDGLDWRDDKARAQWMGETIVEQVFWMQAPLQTDDFRLYIRCTMQIYRKDVIYAIMLGVGAIVILLIPLLILFVNTVESIHTQRQVTKLLYMDTVTGGQNWLYFQSHAEKLLERKFSGKKAYAMVNLHMERYAGYISCYGSRQGEELLACIDGFLRARVGHTELFGHYGSADFGLLLRCDGMDMDERVALCYHRLRSLLAELAGLQPERKLRFYAGVSMFTPQQTEKRFFFSRRREVDVEQIFNYANTAQSVGRTHSEQICFFSEAMLEERIWKLWVENSMHEALAAGEFQVYLQPKYSTADERLVGAEALVRWINPEKGFIPPARFVPIFEENGFITLLDDFMISQIAKLLSEWKVQGKKLVPVSVNISRAHFSHERLAERISQLVDSYGPEHELVELEVTESAFFDDKELLINTIKQLKAYGFPISMDDFGAGYSSLNSLKDIPLDVLKLDAEFFRGEDTSGRGATVIRETIRLAKELNMRVVAEGIENREQVDFLASLGCDMIQGYYFAKPMTIEEFETRVEMDA